VSRELRPVSRFEWEQIILRARLSGLITGNARGTRGGVSGATFKAVALVWASHADPDGGNIYPGDATLAVEAEVSLKVARAVKRKLVELGLTERVKAGARRQHRGDEYRLTLPTALLEVVDVLSPAAVRVAAIDMYERSRGKRGGSSGTPTQSAVGGPPDPVQIAVQGPADPVRDDELEGRGGSSGTPDSGCGGSSGTSVGGPPDRYTNQTSHLLTIPDGGDVRTAVTGPRAREAEDADSTPDETDDTPAARPGRGGCPTHGRAFAAGVRPDGQPACPLCRATGRRPPAGDSRPGLAPVIPIRSA